MTLLALVACHAGRAKHGLGTDDSGAVLPGDHPAVTDADGDGYAPAQGDCDDTRDDVHPGATEYCDRRDHDCNGESYADGVCSGVQPLSDAEWLPDDPGVYAGPPASSYAGQWAADGGEGILTSFYWDGLTDAAIAVIPAGKAFPSIGPVDAFSFLDAPVYDRDYKVFEPAGDVDGDGLDDVLLSAAGCPLDPGVWILPNPATGWSHAESIDDAAASSWTAPIENACFGIAAGGGGDLDGDGYGDILVSQGYQDSNSWDNWGTEDDYGLWVLRGGGSQRGDPADGTFLPVSTEDARWELTYDQLVGDVTGDGLGRMVIQSGERHTGPFDLRVVNPLLDGAATYEDLVSGGATITFPEEVVNIDPSSVSALWDWTGDGVPDLVVNARGEDDGSTVRQEVNIVDLTGWDGSPVGLRDIEFMRVTDTRDTNAQDVRLQLRPAVADLDGDGVPDIQMRAADQGMGMTYDTGCVLPSSHLEPGLNVFEETALCYTAPVDGSQLPLIGDWDASGKADIAFPSVDGDGYWLVPGEDLPWDDPTAW